MNVRRHLPRSVALGHGLSRSVRFVTCCFAAVALAGVSHGQTTLSQWRFNPPTTVGTFGVPVVGTGTYAGVNVTTALLSSTSGPTGSLTDTFASGTSNWGVTASNFPTVSAGSGTAGIGVLGVSTAGAAQVQIGASIKVGRNASKFWQLAVTTDGTAFSPVSGGVGAITAIGTGSQAPSSVALDNAGLLTFVSATNAYTNGDPSGYASFTYTLPTGQGYENISTFGFRLLSIWNPSGSSYVAASPTGTYAGSGVGAGILVDMVTVAGVPEPASCALVASAAIAGMVVFRRRAGRRDA